MLWGISLSFCAFTGWLFLALALQNAPVAAGLLVGCFLLIAVTMLAGTIELTLDYRRHSAMRLTYTGEPPTVGARLDAVIELPASAVAGWVGAELACVRLDSEIVGANRTITFEKDCWSEKRQFPVHRNGMRSSAVIGFAIPDSLPPSTAPAPQGAPAQEKSGRNCYVWQLRLEASGVSRGFRRTLDVQVLSAVGR